MKKHIVLLTGMVLMLFISTNLYSQTTIPPGGTWGNVKGILNDNFEWIFGRTDTINADLAVHLDSIAAHRTAINLRLLKSDTTSMLANYTRNGELAAAIAGKLNVSDTATMLSPYALTSELVDAGIAIGDVRDEIADSLNVLRPLYVAAADTAAMLDPYAKLTDLSEGGDVAALEARVDSIVDVLGDTANIEVILQVDLDTDTLATRAYARSVGGGSATIDSLILNGGSLTLIGDDKLTFQTNGIASYSLPAGGGNLMIQSATQDMISDSLDVIRAMIIDSLLLRSEPIFVFGAGGGNPGDTATFTGSGFPVLGSFNTGRDTLMITQVVGQLWDINTTDTLAIQIMYADSLNQTSFTTVWSSATGINADGLNSTSFASPKIPPRKWVWSRVASAIVGRKPTMINVQLNGYRIKAY